MSDTLDHRVRGQPIKSFRVEVVQGLDEGKSCTAASDVLTIGTATDNDLVLSDPTVSRYHVELRSNRDRVLVEDHGSRNGTHAGGVSIERGSITGGAVLELGATSIRISDGETITLSMLDEDSFHHLRGRTPVMRQVMARIERAAKSEVSILLLGETGTGKEVIARAIHEAGPRRERPFLTVDCGALLPTLVASELFGHEQGAFTGADRRHIGAFERADGGTVFLDEIGELPAALQAALLGALERRRFRRVGGTEEISVDVRILAATHRDLRSEVNAGSFRQDLYYRLAVVLLRVPPLRERLEDIPMLVEHFLREAGHDGPVDAIIPARAMATLEQHHWPGNVRELRNVVEATLAMGEAPPLGEDEGETSAAKASTFPHELVEMSYKDARAAVIADFERFYLGKLMTRADRNIAKAARLGKTDRSYLYQLLKKHGLE